MRKKDAGRSLQLNKQTVVNLDKKEMMAINGGGNSYFEFDAMEPSYSYKPSYDLSR